MSTRCYISHEACCRFVDLRWFAIAPAGPVVFFDEMGGLLMGKYLQEIPGLESSERYFDTRVNRKIRKATAAEAVCTEEQAKHRAKLLYCT